MDERKLGELFKTAVPDAPPPSFDVHDVTAESGRQRLRRRNALLGGSVLGIVVLASATVVGLALWKGADSQGTSAAAGAPMVADSSGNGERGSSEVPNGEAVPQRPADASGKSFPTESPKQGGTPNGNAGPPGPGSTLNGCGQADRELAAALAGELPAAAGLEPLAANVVCPLGSRAAAVPLSDNGKSGVVTIVITTGGRGVDYPVNGSPQGTFVGSATAKDGRRVFLISEPTGSSTEGPFGPELQAKAEHLAAGL